EGEHFKPVTISKASRWATYRYLLPIVLESGVGGGKLLLGPRPSAQRGLPTLRHYLARTLPDALLTTMTLNNLIAIWAARGVAPRLRVIVREANSLSAEMSRGEQKCHRLLPPLMRRWYPEADAVVAPSLGATEDLLQI